VRGHREARALVCAADEAAELANPGRGVTMIKVADEDAVVGFALGKRKDEEVMVAELESGKKIPSRSRALQRHRARRPRPRPGSQVQGRARARPGRSATRRSAQTGELR
jgi:hypothetical protein